MTKPDPADEVRLDIWLWRARFFKTRARASALITKKGVRLTRFGQTRKTNKPSATLHPGDVLTFYRAKSLQTVQYLAPGHRRGPASEAQTLYRQMPEEE